MASTPNLTSLTPTIKGAVLQNSPGLRPPIARLRFDDRNKWLPPPGDSLYTAGTGLDDCDEGEYWQARSVEELRRGVGTYDRLVAAVAGSVKDATEETDRRVQAEIFEDGRFDRLEAEGRQQIAPHLVELRRLLGKLK